MALSRLSWWLSTALHGALLGTLVIGGVGNTPRRPRTAPPLATIDCRDTLPPPRSAPPCELPEPTTEPCDDRAEPLAAIEPAHTAPAPAPPPVDDLAARQHPALDPVQLLRTVRASAPATVPPPTPPPPVAASAPVPEPAPATAVIAPLPGCNPPPDYPAVARRRGWQGTVIVAVTCAADGRVTVAVVVRSSGHDVLDDAALAAIRRWRFDGPGRSEQPVEFRLGRAEGAARAASSP